MTGRAGRWNLDVRPRAPRQLARLPGKIAAAAAGVLTGPLPENPYRAGQLLRDEHAGQYSARRGPDWRFRYRIAEDTHTVIVLDISSLGYLRYVSKLAAGPELQWVIFTAASGFLLRPRGGLAARP